MADKEFRECTECRHFVYCESPKQFFHKSTGTPCDEFKEVVSDMGEQMEFPATFDEFAEQYKIVDKQEVYTNGVALIPIFRVKQWLDNADVVPKSEVAREIFAEIEKLHLHITNEFDMRRYEELKKKYSEGENEG